MKISALRNFICPIDGLSLLKENNILRCDRGHVYDVAREGYCNFLLVQQKASLNPGDNKEMVEARRKFMSEGHFAPVADHLFKIVRDIALKSGRYARLRMVDTGCGDGYYLHQLSKLAASDNQTAELELAGCDISKWAVKAAAKRSPEIAWAVAGNRRLPFAAGTVDLILSMFGYPDWESFKSVQPVEGRVILVDPGPEHLIELRKIIYPEIKSSEAPTLNSAADNGYVLQHADQLQYLVNLESSASIQNLLAMTPHAFRITPKAKENLSTLKRLTLTINVAFRTLKRKR